MPYPPFENAISVDGYVAIEHSGKESSVRYQLPVSSSLTQDGEQVIIVIGKHKYYSLFSVQLIACSISDGGAVKAPFRVLKPMDYVWKNNDPAMLQFYLAVIKFQTVYEKSPLDIESLKALVRNPPGYPFYWHDHAVSEKVTPRSVTPILLRSDKINLTVLVDKHTNHYSVQADLSIGTTHYPLSRVTIHFDYFIVHESHWYLCDNINIINTLHYFKDCHDGLLISFDVFDEFRHDVLSKMEMHTSVDYLFLKENNENLSARKALPAAEKILYLSELDSFVALNPVMRYGQTEIPVLSKKQVYHYDTMGNVLKIERDAAAEDNFIALLLKQRPEFEEQLESPLLYFYINRRQFTDTAWFLSAFEDWRNNNITILGFNDLPKNKLNSYKASITILVSSGINWFNAEIKASFGKQKASLKQLQSAVKNKHKYVQLDDGTLGIIPEEWIRKFSRYFDAGEITDEGVHISKNNYTILSMLYQEHELQEDVRDEIYRYHQNLTNVKAIRQIAKPVALKALLRPYQHEGLSWLNYLDEAGFGGCLADDMGLGKSVQIIAFILALSENRDTKTHLLVVPTTLIYTWEQEFKKFADGIRLYIHHGSGRRAQKKIFDDHDVVITSYGTMVSDIVFLRDYTFDYIFLDESQNIKNPSSQRYQAARLLTSHNKIIITGTPVENNTFDLFAQFSFACPGLLGNRQYFRDTFAIPIDKFKSKRTLRALQARIKPFILRRTKQEVAQDLPEKTEMVVYCEMDAAQRLIYNRYEKEFRDFISARDAEEIPKHTIHILKGLTRLRQICNTPGLIEDNTFEGSSAKIDLLVERIIGLSGSHKILVFSQFVSMLDILRTRLVKESIPHAYLTGATRKRNEVVNEFQNNNAIRVFLISLKAGGTGLNLTAADYVFIVDPWWNPAVENQAIDRLYRIGQQKNVVAVRFICKDTIEEKIMVMQQNKTDLFTSLLSHGSGFTKQDVLALTTTPPDETSTQSS